MILFFAFGAILTLHSHKAAEPAVTQSQTEITDLTFFVAVFPFLNVWAVVLLIMKWLIGSTSSFSAEPASGKIRICYFCLFLKRKEKRGFAVFGSADVEYALLESGSLEASPADSHGLLHFAPLSAKRQMTNWGCRIVSQLAVTRQRLLSTPTLWQQGGNGITKYMYM